MPDDRQQSAPHDGTPRAKPGVVACLVIGAALCVAAMALFLTDPWGEDDSGLSPRFGYEVDQYQEVDPELIHYRETGQVAVAMDTPRVVTVADDDRIFVAGDRTVIAYTAEGEPTLTIPLDAEPHSVAVGDADHASPGRIYVGLSDRVATFDPDGTPVAVWKPLGEKAVLTAIAVAENDVFLADAGRRIVLRCDVDGNITGEIGRRDPEKRVAGFVIPSPYFDLLMGSDGLLRVVNPGAHRIETFTPEGHFESPLVWGRPSLAIDGFCGCCNPINIALLPDGRFVTAEKGVPRVKIYSDRGEFESVVADPAALLPTPTAAEETRSPHKMQTVDVAADSEGRVLVLDPARRQVRVFEKIEDE